MEEEIKVRLNGIDAPELHQLSGKEAQMYLADLIRNKNVTIIDKGSDKYGRMIADVFIDGKKVNEELIKNGHAWHFKNYSSDKKLAELEDQARLCYRGLWASTSPIPPWEFREKYGVSRMYQVSKVSHDNHGGYKFIFSDDSGNQYYSKTLENCPWELHDEFKERLKEYKTQEKKSNFYKSPSEKKQTILNDQNYYGNQPASSGKSYYQYTPSTSSEDVYVKGHYRELKGGGQTYVRPHYRSSPNN